MLWPIVSRIIFILYCVEAGAVLLFVPWSAGWEHGVLRIPISEVRYLFLHPLVRGGLSGLGLVHLVWGAHDLDLLLASRKRR